MSGERRLRSAYDGEKPSLFLEPAPHELKAYLNFEDRSLASYFALDRAKKDDAAPGVEPSTHYFEYGGEKFELTFSRYESPLLPPDRDDWQLQTVPEFQFTVSSCDELGMRHASFQIKPRWGKDMKTKPGENPYSGPEFHGLSVFVQGSNLELDAYPELLRFAADAVDVNARYFDTPHRSSNLCAYERYVRIRRERATPLHKSGGTIERIFEHVGDYAGRREFVDDDSKTAGYFEVARFDHKGAGALLPNHRLGKQIKHYHPKHPRSDASDPLYHPKLGVLFRKSLNRETVPWSEREQVERELDETILNTLSWAGLPTREDSTYIEDPYFAADESYARLALTDDPTPEIRREQNALVVEHVSANPNLTRADVDVLEVMTDGGSQIGDETTTAELADETVWSRRTIYRVLERLGDVIVSKKGTVQFASPFLRESIRSLLGEVRDALERDEHAEKSRSAFAEWKRAYGVEVEDDEREFLQLRLGRLNGKDVVEILREGYRAWREIGRKPRRFKVANVQYVLPSGKPAHKTRALR